MITAIALLLLIIATLGLLQPYFEARTFNKFSETQASYFDALVSELRVLPDEK